MDPARRTRRLGGGLYLDQIASSSAGAVSQLPLPRLRPEGALPEKQGRPPRGVPPLWPALGPARHAGAVAAEAGVLRGGTDRPPAVAFHPADDGQHPGPSVPVTRFLSPSIWGE